MTGFLTRQRVPAAHFPIDRPAPLARRAVLYACVLVAAAAGAGWLMAHAPLRVPGAAGPLQDAWYMGAFKLGLMLGVPAIAFARRDFRVHDLLPDWSARPATVVRLVLAFAAGFLVNAGGWLAAVVVHARSTGALDASARIAAGLVLPLVTAAIPEEFFYRGVLQTLLEKAGGRVVAILVTALLFTAWHLPSRWFIARGVEGQAGDLGSILVGTGLPVLVAGLLFGLAWDRWRSLPVLVAVHWGIDALPFIGSLLGVER